MIPPELLAVADPFTIGLVVFLSQLLRPIVEDIAWFKVDPDRIIFVPLVLGLIVGLLLEATTDTFNWQMALRRCIINSVGAAGTYKVGKVLMSPKVESGIGG